jgi:hypothetical protein
MPDDSAMAAAVIGGRSRCDGRVAAVHAGEHFVHSEVVGRRRRQANEIDVEP